MMAEAPSHGTAHQLRSGLLVFLMDVAYRRPVSRRDRQTMGRGNPPLILLGGCARAIVLAILGILLGWASAGRHVALVEWFGLLVILLLLAGLTLWATALLLGLGLKSRQAAQVQRGAADARLLARIERQRFASHNLLFSGIAGLGTTALAFAWAPLPAAAAVLASGFVLLAFPTTSLAKMDRNPGALVTAYVPPQPQGVFPAFSLAAAHDAFDHCSLVRRSLRSAFATRSGDTPVRRGLAMFHDERAYSDLHTVFSGHNLRQEAALRLRGALGLLPTVTLSAVLAWLLAAFAPVTWMEPLHSPSTVFEEITSPSSESRTSEPDQAGTGPSQQEGNQDRASSQEGSNGGGSGAGEGDSPSGNQNAAQDGAGEGGRGAEPSTSSSSEEDGKGQAEGQGNAASSSNSSGSQGSATQTSGDQAGDAAVENNKTAENTGNQAGNKDGSAADQGGRSPGSEGAGNTAQAGEDGPDKANTATGTADTASAKSPPAPERAQQAANEVNGPQETSHQRDGLPEEAAAAVEEQAPGSTGSGDTGASDTGAPSPEETASRAAKAAPPSNTLRDGLETAEPGTPEGSDTGQMTSEERVGVGVQESPVIEPDAETLPLRSLPPDSEAPTSNIALGDPTGRFSDQPSAGRKGATFHPFAAEGKAPDTIAIHLSPPPDMPSNLAPPPARSQRIPTWMQSLSSAPKVTFGTSRQAP